MSRKRSNPAEDPVAKKMKTDVEEFDEEVDKSYEEDERLEEKPKKKSTKKAAKTESRAVSSDSEVEEFEVKPKKSVKKAAKTESKATTSKASTAKASTAKTSKASTAKTSKASTSKASTAKGKSKAKKKGDEDEEDEDDDENEEPKPKKEAVAPSLNPKFQNPPKISKVNATKYAPRPDPASEVKTDTNKHKFVYDGTTYYLPKVPHEHFQEQWDGICEMRAEGGVAANAAVDTMGCNKLHDEEADKPTQRFQSVVALVLSSMTRDEQTAKAMGKLKEFGCTIDNLYDADIDEVDECIKNLMNHQTKAYQIIHIARICRDKYNDDVPPTKAEMMTLPGAGIKICNLAMYSCWGKIEGIGVDTHLNRILNRLRWTKTEKNREKQIADLETWLPKAMWWDLNEKLLGFGQTICEAKKPKCDQCLISSTCAYYADNF